MTHWSRSGILFTEAHDNAEIMWGNPPAEKIDEGVQRLIARLYTALRRYPDVAEIDEHIYGPTTAPEIVEGIGKAAKVFRNDIGRDPTPAEVQAGLLMADTETALFSYMEHDIGVGDRVVWAEHDGNGEFLRQIRDGRDDALVYAYGTVTANPRAGTATTPSNATTAASSPSAENGSSRCPAEYAIGTTGGLRAYGFALPARHWRHLPRW